MADPEHFNADPDPTFQADADPDPNPSYLQLLFPKSSKTCHVYNFLSKNARGRVRGEG